MKIFQRVRCKAYLKKVKDGVMLNCADGGNPVSGNSWNHPISVVAIRGNYPNIEEKDLSAFEGETVDKTYRERVEENFSGFLVGITYIVTAGKIGTDTSELPIDMYGDDTCEIYHLTKETHGEKVGVVFFKNNAKRYVLLDDMEEEEE